MNTETRRVSRNEGDPPEILGGNMKIRVPKNVENIIGTLESHGYEAYAVGGCVRDTMLGREPQDWDITLSLIHI